MRKGLAFLLILLLSINWMGYEMVMGLLIAHNRQATQRTIAAGRYDAQHLIEIKVDLHLPYATDWPAFEAIEGTVHFQGVVYNFVERKYAQGHMIYRCLPNSRGTELQNAREYFQSLVFDLDRPGDNERAPTLPANGKKPSLETLVFETDHLSQLLLDQPPVSRLRFHATALCNGFGYLPAQPPEA